MAITFTTWLWGDKYNETHVLKLAAGIRRHYAQPFRFIVFSDRYLTLPAPLEALPIVNPELIGRHCFCRLRIFDPAWQGWLRLDDCIVNLDLDLIITGDLAPLFARQDSFLILQGVNATNPNPFNGSVMMLRPGHYREVWSEFSLDAASQIKFDQFPDDQGWLWHKLPKANGWKGGKASGIYAFQKPGWPKGNDALPIDARIVSFIGRRKPEQYTTLPWVRKFWTEAA